MTDNTTDLIIPEGLGTPSNSESTTQDLIIPKGLGKPTSAISAFGKGIYNGFDQIATYGDKFISALMNPMIGGPKPTDFQTEHEQDLKTYKNDPDIQAHPTAATLGQIAGNVVGTAPLLALGQPESLLGSLLQNGAIGATLGGTLGATSPGSGSSLFDPKSAILGSVTGAAGGLLSNSVEGWANAAAKLSSQRQALAAIGAKSSPIASDFTSPMFKSATNNILSNLPSMLGTNSYRDQNFQQFVPDIARYLQSVGASDSNQSIIKLQNILQSKANYMQGVERDAWNAVPQSAKAAGVSNVFMGSLNDLKNQIASNPEVAKSTLNNLSKMSDNMDIGDVIKFKRDLWPDYQFVAKKIAQGTANNDERDLATNLRQMYFGSVDNVQNAVQGTPAQNAFNEANAITVGNKTLFDPQTNKYLTNALDSTKGYLDDVRAFAKNMLSGQSPQRIKTNLALLGDEGSNTLGAYGVGQMLNKHLNFQNAQYDSSGGLIPGSVTMNVGSFLNDINKSMRTGAADVYKPNIDALSGLLQTMQQHVANTGAKDLQDAALKGGMGTVIKSGYLGAIGAAALHNPPLAAAMLITPPALSAIAKYAPLKSALNGVNNIGKYVGLDSDLGSYMLNKSAQLMGKYGISFIKNADGSLTTDKQDNTKMPNSDYIGVQN